MASRSEATNFIRHLLKIREIFINDDRLSPLHVSLYYVLFFEWNENRFKNPFFIDRSEIMNASKIGSANTYLKCLKDLDLFGYIDYLPSHNPVKGSRVNLYTFNTSSGITTDTTANTSTDTSTDTTGVQVVIPFYKHIKHNKDLKHKKDCKGELPFASLRKVDSGVDPPQKSDKDKFSSPSLDKVISFFMTKQKTEIEAEKFFNHYESNGWLVGGKTKMKNWQAAARNWILNAEKFNAQFLTKKQSGSGADRLHVETNKSYDIPL